jgi:hypothetical protein
MQRENAEREREESERTITGIQGSTGLLETVAVEGKPYNNEGISRERARLRAPWEGHTRVISALLGAKWSITEEVRDVHWGGVIAEEAGRGRWGEVGGGAVKEHTDEGIAREIV